jgi:outer membrane beta-barrel protein
MDHSVVKSSLRTALNLTLGAACAGLLLLSVASVARADDQTPAAPKNGDKLDVSGLENKYWAAKDTDFNVVQNRMFSKAGRFALTGQYGMYANDPWSTGPTFAGDLNYYFSERYGVELDYSKTSSTNNAATSNLMSQQGGAPNHNELKQFYGAEFNWVPFYAKISVLNSSIVYFDMSISPGIGMVDYQQQLIEGGPDKTAPAFSLDIAQHYFLSKYLAIRVDYKNLWYNEQITQYHIPVGGAAARTENSSLNSTGLILMGLTVYY